MLGAEIASDVAGCVSTGYSSVNAAAAVFASEMDDYIRQQGLEHWRGKIMPRNSHRSPWATILDLRISQDLPVFRRTRGVLTVDIENLANLLNNDWGQLRQVSFSVRRAGGGRESHRDAGPPGRRGELPRLPAARRLRRRPVKPFETIASPTSVWRVQLGFRIEF